MLEPSRFVRMYLMVMLFVLGLFFIVGGLNEIIANFAPHYIIVGITILVMLRPLAHRKPKAWQAMTVCLLYILVAGLIGCLIISVFLFPLLETIPEKLPTSVGAFKAAMIAGPATLMFVAFAKGKVLRKYRDYYRINADISQTN